ncbi:MAG: hypoxanthine phosphoribosyltransferase [Rikenellaceae bacterium]
MAIVKCFDKEFESFISKETIDTYVEKVAREINETYKNSAQPPIFIGLLNGVYMFASDLMKKIDFQCEITFIKVSSYSGFDSTGKVKQILGLSCDITGRDVILLDEIVDTGNTIKYVVDTLQEMNPRSVKVGTLIYKPNCCKVDTKIDFIGHSMAENLFIVGYGLDYNERLRNLPDIYILCDKEK